MGEDLIPIIGINEENCTTVTSALLLSVKFCDGSGDVVKFNNNCALGAVVIEACSELGVIESARYAIMTARSSSIT